MLYPADPFISVNQSESIFRYGPDHDVREVRVTELISLDSARVT